MHKQIPQVKQLIKDTLYEFLFEPANKSLQKQLESVVYRNCVMSHYTHKSVAYKGFVYNFDTEAPPRRWNRLIPELRPTMDKILFETEELSRYEVPFIMGYITQVLNSSEHLSDYLALLPDCVHPAFKKILHILPSPSLEPAKKVFNQKAVDLIKQRMVTNLLL